MNNTSTYLALGDSYTIGEGIPLYESYPYQTIQLLRKKNRSFNAPEIIAKTGWTTSELVNGINAVTFEPVYNYVSLLIGVNNQYQGQPVGQYAREFEELLKKSISCAGNIPDRVFVLTIPDWGLTAYAKGRDTANITREIEAYNSVNLAISSAYHVHYIDITTGSPESAGNPAYLSGDGLHPSGKAYLRWAKMLSDTILSAAV